MPIARRAPTPFLIDTPVRDRRWWWRFGGSMVALAATVAAAPAGLAQGRAPSPGDVRVGAPSTDAVAGHYFVEQLRRPDLVSRRWPERVAKPVRLWIQPLPATCACVTEFPAMVRAAVAEWEAAGVPVRFAEVADSASAEVHVVWRERLGDDESGRAVWWSTPQGWITRARVTLRITTPTGTLESARTVRAVALHEFGHVLGLGHVEDPQHVMSDWVEVATLSDADRQTARLLYQLPAGPVAPATLAALSRTSRDGREAGPRLVPVSAAGAP